jgi:adenosine deaminase
MAEHPLDRLRRAGVTVSVNTDHPCLLGVTLPGEYASFVDAYGGARMTLRAVAQTLTRRTSRMPRRKRG